MDPEPALWKARPVRGVWARHVRNRQTPRVEIRAGGTDERPPLAITDVTGATLRVKQPDGRRKESPIAREAAPKSRKS